MCQMKCRNECVDLIEPGKNQTTDSQMRDGVM